MRGGRHWWKWGSSLLLAESAAQLGAQIAFLASLGFHLEPRYGTTRISLLLLLGALAGNFLDAAVLVHLSFCSVRMWRAAGLTCVKTFPQNNELKSIGECVHMCLEVGERVLWRESERERGKGGGKREG